MATSYEEAMRKLAQSGGSYRGGNTRGDDASLRNPGTGLSLGGALGSGSSGSSGGRGILGLAGGVVSGILQSDALRNAASKFKAANTPEGLSLADILAMSGGGGGGGGGGARGPNISGLLKQVDKNEKAAKDRYKRNKADLSNAYGQLSTAISDYRPTIEEDFARIQEGSSKRADDLTGGLADALLEQAARREAGLAALGMAEQAAGAEYDSEVALNEAMGDIAATSADWAGLMGANEQNALARNQNHIDAVGGEQNLQLRGLQDALEDYMRDLDAERSAIRAGAIGGGGGGGGGGRSGGGSNAVQTYLQKALIDQYLKQTFPEAQPMSGFGAIASQFGQQGLNDYGAAYLTNKYGDLAQGMPAGLGVLEAFGPNFLYNQLR